MWATVKRAIGYGLLGLFLVPIIVFFTVLVLAYVFDPHCRSGGNSGGCEMGAAGLGFYSALPGAGLGVLLAIWRGYRQPRA